jgi:CHAT domain-containing protein
MNSNLQTLVRDFTIRIVDAAEGRWWQAGVLLLCLIVPSGLAAQRSVRFEHKPTALYLHAWFSEIGSLDVSLDSLDRLIIASAESARMGRFKAANELLDCVQRSNSDGMTLETVAAMRRRIRELQYGDPVSAVDRNGRLGDVALRQLEELGNQVSQSRAVLSGPGRAELDLLLDVESALTNWGKALEDLRRQRFNTIIYGRQWQPTGQGEAKLGSLLITLERARSKAEISSGQEEILAAEATGYLRRTEGNLAQAKNEFLRALQIARQNKSPRGELAFSVLIGDLFNAPFGDPETLGWDLDAEWNLQAAILNGLNVDPYASNVPVKEAGDQAAFWYQSAEEIRRRSFPDNYEARIGWRRYSVSITASVLSVDLATFYTQVKKFRDVALQQGDIRFGTFLWGSQAGASGIGPELDRAVDLALKNGDALVAVRILDYVRANAIRTVKRSLAAFDSLTAAFPIAVKYKMPQSAGDIYFTLAQFYYLAGQFERSIDFSRRAIAAYREYLARAKGKGTDSAATALLFSYLQLSTNLQKRVPGEVRDLADRVTEIDQGMLELNNFIKISPEIIQNYEAQKRVLKIRQALDHAYGESSSCSEYLTRLKQLSAEAHAAGYSLVELDLAGWSGQCGKASDIGDGVKGADLANSVLAAWKNYKTKSTADAKGQFDLVFDQATKRVNLAVNQERFDIVDSYVTTLLPVVKANPDLSFMEGYLQYTRGLALCAKGACNEGASVLETLLKDIPPGTGTDVAIGVLYGLIDVQSKRGDAQGTLFALERLWDQLHINEIARTGVSLQNPKSAELDYLEKKATLDTDVLTEVEQQRRDYLRAAQRLPGSSLSAPLPPDAQMQLSTLPPHTTVLVYHLAALAPVVVRLSTDRPPLVKRLSISPFELTRLKIKFARMLTKPEDGWQSVSAELWKQLVEPVGSFPDDETIAIAAPSVMAGIPFEALGPRENDSLGIRHPVVYLGRLLATGKRTWASSGKNVIVGLMEQSASITPTPDEAKEVGRILKSEPFGDDADSVKVQSALREARIIHVSAHSISDRINLYGSSLLLGGGKPIMAWQLFSLIHSPELIVLSGCETLPQAVSLLDSFSKASSGAQSGARWVVGSRWDITQSAALHVTMAFYETLQEGKSVPVALQKARIRAINNGYKHPSYWAAFQLTAPDLSSLW